MVRAGILLLGLLCAPLQADVLWMSNGDRLSGRVLSMDEAQIRIALPYGEPLTVERTAVKRWRLDKPAAQKPKRGNAATETAAGSRPDNHWYWAGHGDLALKLKRNDKVTDNVDFSGEAELADRDWRYTLEGRCCSNQGTIPQFGDLIS